MTRRDFTFWMQEACLEVPDHDGPDYLGNIDDQLLIFVFPDGSRFGLAVLEEPDLSAARSQIEQGKLPRVRVIEEDLEEDG